MNTYRITYWNSDAKDERHPHGQNVECGLSSARNGLDAIRALLLAKQAVTEAELAEARSIGSNKRLIVFGITFTANKVQAA